MLCQKTAHTVLFTGVLFLFFVCLLGGICPVLWHLICTSTGCLLIAFIAGRFARILIKAELIPQVRISPHRKAVFITGCDHGFGYHLAIQLFKRGFTVFAGCLNPNGTGARTLQDSFESDRMKVIPIDVSEDSSVQDAVTQTRLCLANEEKQLWAVVNNAGTVSRKAPLFEFKDVEDFQKEIEVNQLGVIRVTKSFLPLVRKSKGRLVFMASSSGRTPYPAAIGYSMTKSAIIALANGLRFELRRFGVKVITIEPRYYKTPLTDLPFDQMKSSYEISWKKADEQLKSDYGESYFQETIRTIYKVFSTKSSENIGEVVTAMKNAITLEEPDIEDAVLKSHEQFTLGLFFLCPKKLQDFLLVLAGFCLLPIGPIEWIRGEIMPTS